MDDFPRHTARGIVIKDGRVLLLERWRPDAHGRELHYFSIPGGGIEPGESPEMAVVRELHEELSVIVRPQRLLKVTPRTFNGGGTHTYFLCAYLSGTPALSPHSPEASLPNQRFLPCWVGKDQFARIHLHEEYQPMRAKIAALLAGS